MPRKIVSGTLLDRDSREVLVDGEFQIDLQHRADDWPEFTVFATLHAYLTDLVGKVMILRLSDTIEGEVHVGGIISPPSRSRMRVKILLQDPIWNNLDWFEDLT